MHMPRDLLNSSHHNIMTIKKESISNAYKISMHSKSQ